MHAAYHILISPLVLLASTGSAQDQSKAPPSPTWDFVEFEMKSWGEPVVSWRLTSQGGGSWTETIRGDHLGQYTLVWHEISPSVERYIALEQILKGLPDPAPDSAQCSNFMTDMPYGTIRLTSGATTVELAYNSGCQDAFYTPYLDILRSADELVESWSKDAQIIRSEVYGKVQ